MNRALFTLLVERLELEAQRRDLNTRVAIASGKKPHHQACPLGGLFTGMISDISGSPCWCGANPHCCPEGCQDDGCHCAECGDSGTALSPEGYCAKCLNDHEGEPIPFD